MLYLTYLIARFYLANEGRLARLIFRLTGSWRWDSWRRDFFRRLGDWARTYATLCLGCRTLRLRYGNPYLNCSAHRYEC